MGVAIKNSFIFLVGINQISESSEGTVVSLKGGKGI